MKVIQRDLFEALKARFLEERRFIQILTGPRQVGKTTLAQQLKSSLPFPTFYATADSPILQDQNWIYENWSNARLEAKRSRKGVLLILDEIQKVSRWSDIVKELWDEDTLSEIPLKILLLGSSNLLIHKGLTESLAGRFERSFLTHWSYQEMNEAFGLTLEEYIYFGGYPGAARLINDERRWKEYIISSFVEPVISKDILLTNQVNKPALLRKLFQLACVHSGQILSYQKMLGQLQDAGNTTTLAHYLDLLDQSAVIAGLQKYSGSEARKRNSSPKIQVYNTALNTAYANQTFAKAQKNPVLWGQLVESAVGAHLLNQTLGTELEIFYWRQQDQEVDFVIKQGESIIALEVKSPGRTQKPSHLYTFSKKFDVKNTFTVGGSGIDLEEFLMTSLEKWIDS